jgi:hypothetical protein
VVQTPIFGQFSGHKRADGDTTKRCGDTKDRRGRLGAETKNGRDRRRDEHTHSDGELMDLR